MPVSSLNARALASLPAKFATTVMPLFLSASQIALPMPRVPPVTIATRAISCPIGLLLVRSLVGQQGPSRQRKTPPRRGSQAPWAIGSEAELRSDVDRLAVLLRRLRQGGETITLLRVANARGDIKIAGQAIAARDVDRLVATRIDRARAGAGLGFLFHGDASGEPALVGPRAGRRAEIGKVRNARIRQRA